MSGDENLKRAEDQITSLQRELAEARAVVDAAKVLRAQPYDEPEFWNAVEVLCEAVEAMSAPAPSDVKGEGAKVTTGSCPRQSDADSIGTGADGQLAAKREPPQDSVTAGETATKYDEIAAAFAPELDHVWGTPQYWRHVGWKLLDERYALKSRASLTPLTGPSYARSEKLDNWKATEHGFYGSSAPAAESEGGETTEVERLEKCIEVYERSCTQWAEQCNGLIADNAALSARLAACEERCKELEAGIERHQRQHQAIYEELDGAEKFDRDLWSLLAPKAGGEDAVV